MKTGVKLKTSSGGVVDADRIIDAIYAGCVDLVRREIDAALAPIRSAIYEIEARRTADNLADAIKTGAMAERIGEIEARPIGGGDAG